EKIKAAYKDPQSPDRIHAAETLAKLGYPLRAFAAEQVGKDLEDDGVLRAYVVWGASIPQTEGNAPDFDFILQAFENGGETEMEILAYALVKMGHQFPEDVSHRIQIYIQDPHVSEIAKARLILATILWDKDPVKRSHMLELNQDLISSNIKSVRYEFSEA